MIEVEGLSKTFGSITALKDVSFAIEKGEMVGLLGPNGAGKTTLMRILACFTPPGKGRARVAGHDVAQESLKVRSQIGYFPEGVPLYSDMTVSAFLSFMAQAKGVGKAAIKGKIAQVTGECGLDPVSHRPIGNLSKGYRQRVGLAQALINDPEILILDEPTIGLDPEQVVEFRKLIRDLGGKKTILLSTHILSEVSMICQRVIIMDKGKVVAADTSENLRACLEDFIPIRIEVRAPQEQALRALREMPGVISISVKEENQPTPTTTSTFFIKAEKGEDIFRRVSEVVFRNNWDLRGMGEMEMGLEEVFLRVINKGRKA